MGTGTLVSVEEYLSTTYHPDREYVAGVVLERNVGEREHGKLQAALAAYCFLRRKQWGMNVYTETRVQVSPDNFRIPDLCLVAEPEPEESYLTRPPFLCIEILSNDDRVLPLQEKIREYLDFGVRYVWIVNPLTLDATVYTREGIFEAKDGILKTQDPEIVVPLRELFSDAG